MSTDPVSGAPAEGSDDGVSGLTLIWRSRYLSMMVALLGLMLTTGLFIEQQFFQRRQRCIRQRRDSLRIGLT